MSSHSDAVFRRIVLVRHGESTANLEHTLTGRMDSELTSGGLRQSRRAARYICRRIEPVEIIYSSPLKRCRHTAQIIAQHMRRRHRIKADLEEDDLLLETDFGSWEGKGREDLVTNPEWEHYVRDPFHFTFPGGESPQQVKERVEYFLQKLLSNKDRCTVVVVTHYTPIAFLVLHVMGNVEGNGAPFAIDNGSVTVLQIADTGGYIELLNCIP